MATFFLVSVLLLVLIIWFIAPFIRRRRREGVLLDKIPGPHGLPILGNVHQFVGSPGFLWKKFRILGNEYYPIYKLWSLFYALVNIRHPDDAEVLLSHPENITKSVLYHFLHDWFGTGLLTSTDHKWRRRRKILTPAFHFNVLREFTEIFEQESHRMVDDLNAKSGVVIEDLIPFVTKYTLNTICETAMGTSLAKLESSHEQYSKSYRRSVHELGEVIIRRIMRPWLHPNLIYSWSSLGRLQKQCLQVVRGFSKKIIDGRQEYHNDTKGIHLERFKEDDRKAEETNRRSKNKLAMLDLLIAAKKKGHIDDNGVWEEVDTFMFEGHDTTAMGICFTLLLLAEHTDIQQRVRDEVDELLKKCEGFMVITELQQLPYLERCIKEALRLYPSVPFISRQLTQDIQLKNYIIPAGVMANIHIYDLHRDPNFWPDPLQYDPDRFLPERIQSRHPYSYIPFSAGPRNCIGQKFAMMEMKSMIGHLLHNFYLEPIDLASDISIVTDLVLRPENAARVKFVPR